MGIYFSQGIPKQAAGRLVFLANCMSPNSVDDPLIGDSVQYIGVNKGS